MLVGGRCLLGMSATAAGCGSSVGMNFGKEYYKMIINAGYRGKVGAASKFTYTGQYNVRKDGVVELLTSGTIVFLEPKVIDVFMVGGGGGGKSPSGNRDTGYGYAGGAGGYTRTIKRVSVPANTNITVTVGAGGATSDKGEPGGASAFSTFSVSGAERASYSYTQQATTNGGSGGGGGVQSNSDYGTGGSDGNSGESGYPITTSTGGTGQRFTTREFGEAQGKLYAGGGGGGRYMAAQSPIVSPGGTGGGGSGAWSGSETSKYQVAAAGVANTGSGGGGGAGPAGSVSLALGASGGSGIVCFRDAQELPELAGTWVFNDRIYAPENAFDVFMKFKFTFNNEKRECTRIRVIDNNNNLAMTARVISEQYIYSFKTNRWNGYGRTMIIPADATASNEFREWLASNATKQ